VPGIGHGLPHEFAGGVKIAGDDDFTIGGGFGGGVFLKGHKVGKMVFV
jgi:hypothetical protein